MQVTTTTGLTFDDERADEFYLRVRAAEGEPEGYLYRVKDASAAGDAPVPWAYQAVDGGTRSNVLIVVSHEWAQEWMKRNRGWEALEDAIGLRAPPLDGSLVAAGVAARDQSPDGDTYEWGYYKEEDSP